LIQLSRVSGSNPHENSGLPPSFPTATTSSSQNRSCSLAARVEQVDWDHHSVLQHPIDIRLAVSRALLDIHVGQAEAVEEDDG
jgi:hypothetical protein